jgi:ssDNA-binding Zn-finger/Zn-ribbon topoisomerase 1
MMQVRCQKCGWSFTLSRDAIETIVNEVQESKATHYTIDCPKCRQGIKVQTRRIKRFYRPQATPETAEENAE